jgi:tRNA A22 N-methylase
MGGRFFQQTMIVWAISWYSSPCYSFFWVASHSPIRWRAVSSVQFLTSKETRRYCSTKEGLGDCGSDQDLALARNAFAILAKKSKSWKRLGPMIDLALDDSLANRDGKVYGICDVGTDHGLLAIGLAMTNRFHQVVGVDVSERAIQDGALKLQNDILSFRNNASNTGTSVPRQLLPLDFRMSDGLQSVQIGEADIVCIAGMGVHTMVDILKARKEDASSKKLILDHLSTQRLLLQPTNSRPHLLMYLYNSLHNIGWVAQSERIEYISSRWYLTTSFERSQALNAHVPGSHLFLRTESNSTNDFVHWVAHHRKWILSDTMNTGTMRHDDKQWIEEFKQLDLEILNNTQSIVK